MVADSTWDGELTKKTLFAAYQASPDVSDTPVQC